jgi:hypothetical protein
MTDNYYRKIVLSNKLIDEINVIAVATRNASISHDQAFLQKEKDRIDAARSKYGLLMKELYETALGEKGKTF